MRHPSQFVSRGHDRLNLGEPIDDLAPCACNVERVGLLERGLHRTAPAQGSTAIAHARKEAQLQGIGQMRAIGGPAARLRARDQLEDGLAVTVLEILAPQTVTVSAQQKGSPGKGDRCELVQRVAWT